MSKYSLKNEYKNILKEFRVNVENDNFYYDYEVSGNLENIDFKKFEFKDKGGSSVQSTLERIIPKNSEMKTQERGAGKFEFQNLSQKAKALLNNIEPARLGSGVQILVLKAIDNIIISDKKAYGFIRREDNLDDKIKVVFEVIRDRLSREEEVITEVLKDICTDKTTGYNDKEFQAIKTFMLNFNSSEYNKIYKKITTGSNNKINTTVEKYFVTKSKSQGQFLEANLLMSLIADAYIGDGPNALSLFLRGLKTQRANRPNTLLGIRKDYSVDKIKSALEELNNTSLIKINDLAPGYRKGRGEFLIHMLFNTTNACLSKEPDAIFKKGGKRFSIKSSASTARTGENMSTEIREATDALLNFIDLNTKVGLSSLSYSEIPDKLATKTEIPAVSLENLYKNLKIAIVLEHEADGLIIHKKDNKMQLLEKRYLVPDNIILTGMKNNRWSFTVQDTSTTKKEFELAMRKLIYNDNEKYTYIKKDEHEEIYQMHGIGDSYTPKGKVLKEVYSNLFKKKLVKEGGLGGHMRHPYENLDVTPREMMDRIESYGVPQTVIDKVDGQNLFFTVDRDGTLLFARNKQDMTHQDLVDKFTGHGAEAAFLEGGEAIKRGVEQWLGSAGNFADQEVLDIFHPTEDIRSFINFEIMHPKNSNQIQYDKKYIVFHSIVDFGEGRSKIFSSNQDDRLKKLISLMNAGVSSTGFELASNREIDLNTLSNVQIMVYTDRVRELIEALDMKEDEFLADGILRIIDEELSQEGVNLEENTLKIMRDFVLYGEDGAGDAITSRDFTKHISKEDTKTLRALGLTSATKAKAKVAKILSPFKEIFVDLGIDLLKGVDSAYLSPEQSKENITGLRDKLQTAIEDYDQYIMSTPEDELSKIALRLKPHVDKIKQVGIDKAVSTSVEGGVYTQDLDLEKITGGFAPLNQIVGAAYRDKEGIFPNFQDKFSMNENKRYSLKSVFNLDD